MTRSERLGRGFFWFTLLVSLVGFLGYYDANGFVAPPPAIVFGLQLCSGIVAAVFLRERLWSNRRAVFPLLMVALWAAASLMWADDPGIALRRWLLVFAPGLLVCTLAASDPRPRQTFIWFAGLIIAIVLASGVFSGAVIAFWDTTIAENALRYFLLDLNGWMLGVAEGGRQYELGFYIPRYSGLTSNPNSMSLFAAISLITLAAMARPERNRQGLGLILIILLVVFLLLLSGSRAAFAMTAAGMFFVVLLRMNQRSLVRVSVFAVCAMALALYAMTWTNSPAPELVATEARTLDEGAVATGESHKEVFELRERSQTWRIAMETITHTWKLGSGFGLTQEIVYAPLGLETAAHSLSLSSLVEIGVVGLALILIAWFAPVFRVTQRARSISPMDIAIVALLMGLFVHQAVDSSIFRYHWAHFLFAYLLGAGAGLSGSRTSE